MGKEKISVIVVKNGLKEMQICEGTQDRKTGKVRLTRCTGMFSHMPTRAIHGYDGKFIGYADTKVLKGRTKKPYQFYIMKSKKEIPTKYD